MFECTRVHQGHPVKPQPLTDAEFERLSGLLGRFDNKRPMNLEQLDGFLAALICGPSPAEMAAPRNSAESVKVTESFHLYNFHPKLLTA